jgi:hypothetical protein
MKSRVCLTISVLPVALVLAGCEEKTTNMDQLVSAAQESAKTPPPPPPSQEWKEMPEITVDELGAYIGGERAELQKKEGAAKLHDLVGRLPINNKTVTMLGNRNARVQDVAAVVWELGKAGAPAVVIKTEGRSDLAKEIRVTPESRLTGTPPDCSVAVTVTDELDTGVWILKGGGGLKTRKGFAGPDVSNTEEGVKKKLKVCESKYGFFGGSHKHKWLHAFSMGAVIRRADTDKKISDLVLLTIEPVAGRAVEIKK